MYRGSGGWALLLAAAVLTSCGGATDPVASSVGTYELAAVNDATLPQEVTLDNVLRVRVRSGTLTVRGDRTATMVRDFFNAAGTGLFANTQQATVAPTGGQVSLTFPTETTTGTVEASGFLTFRYAGATYRWRRQR